ncbi:heme exporter protein CcmD [Phaeovulum sp.]|jgi:heme exporter protein D|uniref:heme exporter protein CcmD n=1 Tax=Phaeovulum sp. TaxID=2934796 RepID=UPI00272F522A|nr:heme exporter protein CcmD [Phaeovulum sp.]MDP1667657.1 heme exporter protein CcmD [Phaeovulum sp.]MDP2062511.1 heme exporter protein CcmD [Phaeovulum sp.]MDP3860799.1 heme exporter protein CcmD [Phaeovulum sp.]MDZ4118452.1 heme exporter protein CcmD [Phaeovulum sp.]
MMPELGKYAVTVMSAYGVTVVLLLALVVQSLWRSARIKRALDAQEKRMGARNG